MQDVFFRRYLAIDIPYFAVHLVPPSATLIWCPAQALKEGPPKTNGVGPPGKPMGLFGLEKPQGEVHVARLLQT